MFVDPESARRIERAEAQLMRDMTSALAKSGRATGAFVRELNGGVAVFSRAGSPMNKVIGAGLDAPFDDDLLGALEATFAERAEPVRVELSTLAVPETGRQLTERGYRLQGFENLLARPIGDETLGPSDIVLERMTAASEKDWGDIAVGGFANPDDSGVPADHHSLEMIRGVIEDSLAAGTLDRYLARCDGVLCGAASMRVHDGVAMLTGSTTLAKFRRRGVQAALITQRLFDAAAAGAEIVVITTAPGTQSQANAMKRGFGLAYSRAILSR